jgi:hypothetical protein
MPNEERETARHSRKEDRTSNIEGRTDCSSSNLAPVTSLATCEVL